MKHKEMSEIIEDRFKAINKLLHNILRKFNAEDIPNFRVEVKKCVLFCDWHM